MADRRTVAEGAFSAPVVAAAARAQGIDMPITDAVARLVAGETQVADAVQALLSRPLRPEGRCSTTRELPAPPARSPEPALPVWTGCERPVTALPSGRNTRPTHEPEAAKGA